MIIGVLGQRVALASTECSGHLRTTASAERMASSAAAYKNRPPGPAKFIAAPPTKGPIAVPTLPDEIGQKLRRAVDDDGPMAVPDQSPRDVDALTVELNDADLMCCSAFHYSEREIAVLSS